MKNKIILQWRWCSSILLGLLLTGCVNLSPVSNPVTEYNLTKVSTQALQAVPTQHTLLVAIPTASAAYQSSAMLYTENQSYAIAPFSKNRWVAPPSQMLLPLLVQSLQNTHYFHAVVTTPSIGTTDYRLETRIMKFQQEFIDQRSQFSMTLQMLLIANKSNKILLQKQFTANVAAPYASPEGGVIAANSATQQILQQIARWSVATAQATRK